MLRCFTVTLMVLTKYSAVCTEGPDPVPPDLVVDPVPPDLVVGTRADDLVPSESAGCGCGSLQRGSAVEPEGGRTSSSSSSSSSVRPDVKYSRVLNEMPSNPRRDEDTTSQVRLMQVSFF